MIEIFVTLDVLCLQKSSLPCLTSFCSAVRFPKRFGNIVLLRKVIWLWGVRLSLIYHKFEDDQCVLRSIYTKRQRQLCDDASDSALIEINGDAWKWVAKPFWSVIVELYYYIAFYVERYRRRVTDAWFNRTLKFRLHVTSPSLCPSKFNILPIVTDTLTDKMGCTPILYVSVHQKDQSRCLQMW